MPFETAPTYIFDLHCDTLAEYWKYAHTGNPDTLDNPGRVLSLSNMPKDVHWAQFYAVFIPDEERGQAAIDYFEKNRANFYRQVEKFGDRVAPCRNADAPYEAGVSFVTMVDGFLLSDNVAILELETVDNGFLYSDHNPVRLRFTLRETEGGRG